MIQQTINTAEFIYFHFFTNSTKNINKDAVVKLKNLNYSITLVLYLQH